MHEDDMVNCEDSEDLINLTRSRLVDTTREHGPMEEEKPNRPAMPYQPTAGALKNSAVVLHTDKSLRPQIKDSLVPAKMKKKISGVKSKETFKVGIV